MVETNFVPPLILLIGNFAADMNEYFLICPTFLHLNDRPSLYVKTRPLLDNSKITLS